MPVYDGKKSCCQTKFVPFLDESPNLAAQDFSINRYTLASKKPSDSVLLHSDETRSSLGFS